MYGFVIWDRVEKKLFGARDIFGIKPFYYAQMNGTFLFGSEIKSFVEHPKFDKVFNEDALADYLSFQMCIRDSYKAFCLVHIIAQNAQRSDYHSRHTSVDVSINNQ